MKKRALFIGLALGLALACSRKSEPPQPSSAKRVQRSPSKLASVTPVGRQAALREDEAAASCVARVKALGGTGDFAAPPFRQGSLQRAELLARARAEPVLFSTRPEVKEPLSPIAAQWRRSLEQQASWGSFETMVRRFSKQPAVLREIVLTEDYLYAESPGLAVLYSSYLTLGALFREPVLNLERGTQRYVVVRGENGYEYADGPERGKTARLLLFDRISVAGKPPSSPRHVSAQELARELGFDEVDLENVTEQGIAAKLRYGGTWVPAALEARAGRLQLTCEALPAALKERVDAAREQRQRLQRALEPVRAAIRDQVDESLPFDEPKTEDGQQDGKLRPEWRWAYLQGRTRYEFNGDKYWVFDRNGRPHVPQVCIDFIADTFERASGTWWRARGEARERVVGRLDFGTFELENKRSVEQFIAFASGHPELFEVHTPADEERIPLRHRGRFFGKLYERRQQYQPGDIVVIYGLRDDEKFHYHSFFVYDADPLTGMPTLVAANAGRPRIRTWEGEMQNAPRRSIQARIRPRLTWLEALSGPPSVAASEKRPPPPG